MSYYFTILGSSDVPLYELDIGTYRQSGDGAVHFPEEIDQLKQFIINASIDILQDVQFKTNHIFYNNLDSFYGYQILGYLTQGNTKFMILTNSRSNDESIRQFFIEINEIYVKKILSPFYKINTAIIDANFDSKVRLLAKKYL